MNRRDFLGAAAGTTVAVTVTNQAGDVVESLAGEDIEPGIGRPFTSAGYPDDRYLVAVEDDGEGVPAWKQTTRWSNLAECPSLVFELRLTDRGGVRNVTPSKRCESSLPLEWTQGDVTELA